MNSVRHLISRWYSNDSLAWVWGRATIVAIIMFVAVITIHGGEDKGLLILVAAIPLLLAIFNTIFRRGKHFEDESNPVHNKAN
jgi:hypothetical protein